MKACVEEVRVSIVRAVVEKGLARAQAAELFGVSVPSVGRFARALGRPEFDAPCEHGPPAQAAFA